MPIKVSIAGATSSKCEYYPGSSFFPSKIRYFASMLRWWFIGVALLVGWSAQAQVLPSFGDSRTGTTGLQFLKIAPDARSAGMAQSYIAVVNDVTALYWNPAGITQVDSFDWHFTAGHTQYIAETQLQHAAAVKQVGGDSYLGVSMIYFDSGEMPVTTEFQPFGTGQSFRAVDMALGLTFAQRLTDAFSFGLTAKYVNESIADVNTHAVMVDFGFQYDVGLANTRFAVGINNFGPNTTPSGSLNILNVNGNMETLSDFEQIAIPSVFRLGFAWDAIKQEKHLLTFATQLNHPTDNNETLGFGAEYLFNRLLFIRGGYLFGADETALPAFGFGLNLQRRYGHFTIDYGFNSAARIGATHRLTFGLSLF